MSDKYHFSTLNRIVIALCGEHLSDSWWNSPNKAFNNQSPMSYMTEDNWTQVRDYLLGYAYGSGYSPINTSKDICDND
jgi:hypothetical protein